MRFTPSEDDNFGSTTADVHEEEEEDGETTKRFMFPDSRPISFIQDMFSDSLQMQMMSGSMFKSAENEKWQFPMRGSTISRDTINLNIKYNLKGSKIQKNQYNNNNLVL